MNYCRHFRLRVLFFAVLLAGCAAKKTAGPPLPPAAAAATPASTPEGTPQPTPTPAQQSQLPTQGTPPPEPEQNQQASGKNDKKSSSKQNANGKKSAGQTAKNAPPKIVVRPDPATPSTSGTISPGGAAVASNEPTTEQLLQSTENGLNNLNRQLSADDQDTVTHIRDYINQSRQATKDNDAIRAHNFAQKAHTLLFDDLMKRH